MSTVFIAGSMTIKRLDPKFVARLQNIVTSKLSVAVGDADGADTSIQNFLLEASASAVTVYCSGSEPRNNVGSWPVHTVRTDAKPGTRTYFTAKDIEMAKAADYGLMVWDAKSIGTLSNVIELLKRGKKCVVFLNKGKTFLTVAGPSDLERLVSLMSDGARAQAESKINLTSQLDRLGQFAMQV